MTSPTPQMSQQERNALLGGILGDAMIDRLLGSSLVGFEPGSGTPLLQPSPLAMVAQQVWYQQQHRVMAAVVDKVDLDALAEKIAEFVVAALTKPESRYDQNLHRADLTKRVLEIVAQQLGQRVVDQMDLQIGPKEVGA